MQYTYGYRKVTYDEKIKGIQKIFQSVAHRYDLMNDLMSFGLHRLWKNYLVKKVAPFPGIIHLDLAGGTGDIAFRLWKHVKDMHPLPVIFVGDLSYPMLVKGRDKSIDRGYIKKECLKWVQLNSEHLPFPKDTFDTLTFSFGLRNVAKRNQTMQEIYRVLKPNGRALIMEFSEPIVPLEKMSRFYMRHVLPFLGKWVVQDREAYQYLVDSIDTFLKPSDVQKMMAQVGFLDCQWNPLSGGIVAIYQCVKPMTSINSF